MSDNEPDYSPRAIKIDDETLYSRPVEWSDDTCEKVTKYELVCSRCSQMIHARVDDSDLTDDNSGQLYKNGDDEHILLSHCADDRGDCPLTSMLVTMETEKSQEEPVMSDKLRKRAERRARMQQVKSDPPPPLKQAPVPPASKEVTSTAASSDININIEGKSMSENKVDKDKRAKAPVAPAAQNMESCPFADPTATGELVVMDDRPELDPEVVAGDVPDEDA